MAEARIVVIGMLVAAMAVSVADAQPPARPGATAAGPGRSGAPPRPILAEGYTVTPAAIASTIPVQGTLVAAEQVDIVSEVSRRLVRIDAAEGADVKKGDLLLKLDDQDLLAEIDLLAVRRRLAESNLTRIRDLWNAKSIAQAQYDEAVNAVQLIDAQERILRVELAKTEIRAPFDGVLGRRHVSEGAWVTPSMVLATLYALDEIDVQFSVPERYGPSLRKGMEFSFRPPGFAHDEAGTVTLIEPAIETSTRSVVVVGLVENKDRELRPGAFVSLDLRINEIAGGLMIPAEAVVPTLRGHSVYVLKDGKAASRDIKLGIRTPAEVQVLDGLAAGDIVLTTNLLRLRPGSAVTLNDAAAPTGTPTPAKGS